MQGSTLVLQRVNKRAETAPRDEVRRTQGRLHVADAPHQHVQVVQSAEQILRLPQRRHVDRHASPADAKFRDVAKLLHSDAHAVQSLTFVQMSGRLDGTSKTICAAHDAGLNDRQRRYRGPRSPASATARTASSESLETVLELLHPRERQSLQQLLPGGTPSFFDGGTYVLQRSMRMPRVTVELADHQLQH